MQGAVKHGKVWQILIPKTNKPGIPFTFMSVIGQSYDRKCIKLPLGNAYFHQNIVLIFICLFAYTKSNLPWHVILLSVGGDGFD